ncbi:unnamed protein product [Meganyctiphanes norvegica]|uniref:Endonuclease/exonuclease/phosphatase domain-containing protein n=1 Tax=Meganyctiphanes norvegica TaxID=48144 RepID=A0AAV2R3C7_MEGNR
MKLRQGWGFIFCALIIPLLSSAYEDLVKPPLRIGAWNAKRLGATKMKDTKVVEYLVKVIQRYDIIAILEVRDITEETPYDLLNEINKEEELYQLTLSARVGRTSQKEQYAIYWKASRVTAIETFQYNDTVKDVFTYDPFTVTFQTSEAGNLTQFAMTTIHTRPDDATEEIDALVDVYDQFLTEGGVKDMVILGDFNMGCTYVTSKDLENIRLHNDLRFTWLISDHADTTTGTTTCPYDRIVLAGPTTKTAVYPETAGAFYYDEEYGITDQELLDDISDHYPVEVLLRGTLSPEMIPKWPPKPSVAIEVDVRTTPRYIKSLAKKLKETTTDCQLGKQVVTVRWTNTDITSTIDSLTAFSEENPKVITKQALAVLSYKLQHGVMTDSSLYGTESPSSDYEVRVLCYPTHNLCTTTVKTSTLVN